ncbi:MAG: bifunctional methylenetetrahydrofolate dehydrogenase/methenyltetrahydrofolate cyclohydrolase FolD [Pseudomonadales bacterium]|jgi:methylenetetrahydrofolate dehydrogenase (NADP+)/methenyltetrahydrofolate cyclohydrolase|nr:bifunctional methylenetetrahydrofolate dehydrogenase/methenyltetrahydrofolate cyclohydrolase FolD [Pseudomonadales bacterium]MDP6473133.1 bifunctional methylenetetrahydrofolate dehydrogenase/methenyltetrahydrofolate cyclohydrolase FolD [Pseudomonadales bacterium]MDP6826110.1 bifunctional methylenetetrahydrofolate dehydrogenase/methenyltetrahydrofolate cyclohydrolase FolD [Pseudomonadales bacterium]MDP6971514.1 bifunctional methylenetetrahydrofolate dehydrogenase/methenyltetrahydrofolate cyclo|tara:strand:+ start:128 stop:985 length:858 start_codon:yes stop_codon:yes gene_type:complete
MPAQILNGNLIARQLRADIRHAVEKRTGEGKRPPGLAVILVGNDPASLVYVGAKRKDCERVGFHSIVQHLSDDVEQSDLEERVIALNEDPGIDGVLVQSPLPDHIDEDRIIDVIDPNKDVDGFHPYNIGRLAVRRPTMRSCTPKGVMQLIERTDVDPMGCNATVIGASNHLGRPMGLELLLAGATVTMAHKFTRDTAAMARSADILISAVGKRGLVKPDWVKPGAVVIDVGITRDEEGKLHGDVMFGEVREIASWITPVPGGVGPMTRVALLQNTLKVCHSRDAA